MSWVYWGIVLGFFALVVTLLVSFDIYYGAHDTPDDGATGHLSEKEERTESSSKHAA